MRTIPPAFDSIRPYEPEELPTVFDRLLADKQFLAVLAQVFPGTPLDAVTDTIRKSKTNMEFQMNVCYGFLDRLLAAASDGCDMDCGDIDPHGRYTFVSNHRDIVLDSALLDKLLVDARFDTTCEIAIGDNLLAAPWIEDLVRVNKSFIVRRGVGVREMLTESRRLSEYMHFAIRDKKENIWIAQREGRAKDSDDRTQPSILKMMTMGGEGTPAERLAALHIVPVSISYEYDPCDYLKAAELQLKRDVKGWKKSSADDVLSMKTGIMGRKGHIHYHLAPCIDDWIREACVQTDRGAFFDAVARHVDEEIHKGYHLYPVNYAAADALAGCDRHADKYTAKQKTDFTEYIESRIALIDIPGKDDAFLRERLLTMYANPVSNQEAARINDSDKI